MPKMPKDMQQIMQQAQSMQQQMMAAQEALAHRTFEGTAGGGAVKAVIKGTGELLSVDFEASVLDPDDPEMAGDLVVAAVNQAMAAMSADADSTMGGLAGGLRLGGMLG